MSQSTLSSFAPEGPQLTGGCDTCHRVHRQDVWCGQTVIRCLSLDYVGPAKALCQSWWPPEPLVFWPALADNYGEGPKKWRARA